MKKEDEKELQEIVEDAFTRRVDSKNQSEEQYKGDPLMGLYEKVNEYLHATVDENEIKPKFIEVRFKQPKLTVMAIHYHHYVYGEIFDEGNERILNYSNTPTEKLLDYNIDNLELDYYSGYSGMLLSQAALYTDKESEFKAELEGFNIVRNHKLEMPKILRDCLTEKFHESLIETARKDPQKFKSIIYIYENSLESFNELVIEPGLAKLNFTYPSEFDVLMKRTYPHFTNWMYCFIEKHGRKDFLDFVTDLESEIHNNVIREIIEKYPSIEDEYDSVYHNDYALIDIRHSKIILFEMPFILNSFYPLLSYEIMEHACNYRFF